eukprot:9131671-Heterocapsa_arctica.AAC.1
MIFDIPEVFDSDFAPRGFCAKSTFDATRFVWPTLRLAKELPRRLRQTVYKDGGASARTAATRVAA